VHELLDRRPDPLREFDVFCQRIIKDCCQEDGIFGRNVLEGWDSEFALCELYGCGATRPVGAMRLARVGIVGTSNVIILAVVGKYADVPWPPRRLGREGIMDQIK